MENQQAARLNRNQTVVATAQEHPEILEENPGLQDEITDLQANITATTAAAQIADSDPSGTTANSDAFREEQEDRTLIIAGFLYAIAIRNSNNELLAIAKITKSSIDDIPGVELVSIMRGVHDAAREHETILASKYKFTQTDRETYLTDINTFETETKNAPQIARSKVNAAKKEVKTFIRQSNKIITVIKRYLRAFRKPNPDFYYQMLDAIRIIDPATSHTAASISVTNVNGEAIRAATIRFTNQEDTTKVYNFTTNGEGQSIERLPQGLYTLDITAAGFTDYHQMDLRIFLGRTKTLNIQLSAG